MVTTPLAAWALAHLRDLSLVTSGSILVALGLRQVRASGVSLRTVAYPLGGMFLFAILTGFLLAKEATIASAISTFGTDAPAEMTEQLDTLRRGRSFWTVIAVISGLAGLFTPLRPPAA